MRFLIRYNGKNLHRIGVATGERGKPEKNILRTSGQPKRFFPGINVITLDEWNDIKHSQAFQNLLNNRILIWEGPSPEGYKPDSKEKVDADSLLAGLSNDKAASLVDQTLDRDLLLSWREKETRRGVVTAIEKQISALTIGESDFEGKVEKKRNRG